MAFHIATFDSQLIRCSRQLMKEHLRRPLSQLLLIPYNLSPGWLLVDPTFDALRDHPRFRALVKGTA